MITWLITSLLLSCTGILLYLLLQRVLPAPRYRKLMLYVVLGLSIVLPFFIFSNANPATYYQSRGTTTVAITPIVPSTVQEYCHCEEPGQGEIISFEASRIYNFLLQHNFWLLLFPGIVAFLLLVRFSVRCYRLSRLAEQADELDLLEGQVKVIRKVPGLLAASFRLIRGYLVWDSTMDQLPEAEREAVLRHELSHLRQFNTWEELFLELLQTVWVLNPAFYFIRKELRKLSEFIADDAALATGIAPREYALLLLKLKSLPVPNGLQAFSGSLLKQRIERLAQPPRKNRALIIPMLFVLGISLYGVNAYAETMIRNQMEAFQVYEYLYTTHEKSGKTAFCKNCTYQKVFGTPPVEAKN